jgi:hypothetical protein
VSYRPYHALKHTPEQPSYPQPLLLSEAAVYPGFLNRRIRWDSKVEQMEKLTPAHWKSAYELAAPSFDAALASYRQMLKNPLAGEAAIVLLRCRSVGRIGDLVVLEDAGGHRIGARDCAPGETNVANLVRAAGGLRDPAVLVRLYRQWVPLRIVAQPLAVITPELHLQLGL